MSRGALSYCSLNVKSKITFIFFCFFQACDSFFIFMEGTFFIEGGRGRGILEFFCKKSRGPPISWNGLMHDPSEIPKQKHLTLPLPIQDKNNRK